VIVSPVCWFVISTSALFSAAPVWLSLTTPSNAPVTVSWAKTSNGTAKRARKSMQRMVLVMYRIVFAI
jgi:hypothetical protein